ncbi:hypothetical protein [Legionella yabuuchiae]|uniref:hypothetical protein n=1 Tax=Legionella yabuuchiae TaxID=376727 RepID=UPI0010559BCE|nr:hypothetical protein [Legionella yabuuchiae]
MFESLRLTDEQRNITTHLILDIARLLQQIIAASKTEEPTQVVLPPLSQSFIDIKKTSKQSDMPIEKIWQLIIAMYNYLSVFRINVGSSIEFFPDYQHKKRALFKRLFCLLQEMQKNDTELLYEFLNQLVCYDALICIFAEIEPPPQDIDTTDFSTFKTFLFNTAYTHGQTKDNGVRFFVYQFAIKNLNNTSLNTPFLIRRYIEESDFSTIGQSLRWTRHYLLVSLHSILALKILSHCKYKAVQNELLLLLNSKTKLIETPEPRPMLLHLDLLTEHWLILRNFSVVNSNYLNGKAIFNVYQLAMVAKIIDAFNQYETSIPTLDNDRISAFYLVLNDMMNRLTHNGFQHPFLHYSPSQLANSYGRMFLLPKSIPMNLLSKYPAIVPSLLHLLYQHGPLGVLYQVLDVVDTMQNMIQRLFGGQALLSERSVYHLKILHWLAKNIKNGLQDFEQTLSVEDKPIYQDNLFNKHNLDLLTYKFCFFIAIYLLKIERMDTWPLFQSFIKQEMNEMKIKMPKELKRPFSSFLELIDFLHALSIRKTLPDKKHFENLKAISTLFSGLMLNPAATDYFKHVFLGVLYSSLEPFCEGLESHIGEERHKELIDLYFMLSNIFNELNISDDEREQIKNLIQFESYLAYQHALESQLIRAKDTHSDQKSSMSLPRFKKKHRRKADSKRDAAAAAAISSEQPSSDDVTISQEDEIAARASGAEKMLNPAASTTVLAIEQANSEPAAIPEKEKLWCYVIDDQERIAKECQQLYGSQTKYWLQKQALPKPFKTLCSSILEHLGMPLILTGSSILKLIEHQKLTDLDCILFNVDLNQLQRFLFKLGLEKVSTQGNQDHSLLRVIIEEFEKSEDGSDATVVSYIELDIVSKKILPNQSVLDALAEDAKSRDFLGTTMHVICGKENQESYPIVDSLGAYERKDELDINPYLYNEANPAEIFLSDPPRILRLINAHLASPHKRFGQQLNASLKCLFDNNNTLLSAMLHNYLEENKKAVFHRRSFITKMEIILARYGLSRALKEFIDCCVLPVLCHIRAKDFLPLIDQSQQLEYLLQENERARKDYDPYVSLYLLVLTLMHQVKRCQPDYPLQQTPWYCLTPKNHQHHEMIKQWQDHLERHVKIDFKKFPLLKLVYECTRSYWQPKAPSPLRMPVSSTPPTSLFTRGTFFPQPDGRIVHAQPSPPSTAPTHGLS